MTADIPEDRPLQLGDLVTAESPDLVRAALRRFRRRLLVRGLIVVLVIAAGLVLYPRYFGVHADLIHDIRHGHGIELDRTLTVGGIDAYIREVARLSRADSPRIERYGVHITILDRTIMTDERLIANVVPATIEYFPTVKVSGVFEVAQQTGGGFGHELDLYVSLTPGTRTLDIPMSVVATRGSTRTLRSLGTIHLDMQQLNVPDWIWR